MRPKRLDTTSFYELCVRCVFVLFCFLFFFFFFFLFFFFFFFGTAGCTIAALTLNSSRYWTFCASQHFHVCKSIKMRRLLCRLCSRESWREANGSRWLCLRLAVLLKRSVRRATSRVSGRTASSSLLHRMRMGQASASVIPFRWCKTSSTLPCSCSSSRSASVLNLWIYYRRVDSLLDFSIYIVWSWPCICCTVLDLDS